MEHIGQPCAGACVNGLLREILEVILEAGVEQGLRVFQVCENRPHGVSDHYALFLGCLTVREYHVFLLDFWRGPVYNWLTGPSGLCAGSISSCLAAGIWGPSHATQNRRVVVIVVNRSTTSGNAALRAFPSSRDEVTAFQVTRYSPA